MEKITRYYQSRGIALGRLELVRDVETSKLAGAITLCPPSALNEVWSRRFPDPVRCLASGWMRVRARARQHLVQLPLVISDHADWDGLTGTIAATGAEESGHPRAGRRAGALEPHAGAASTAARYSGLWRRGRRSGRRAGGRRVRRLMKRFAALLDRLAYEPSRNNKLRLMTDAFRDHQGSGARLGRSRRSPARLHLRTPSRA